MVALTENLDHAVKSTDELAWLTGMPVLGQVEPPAHLRTGARQALAGG